MVVDSGHFEGGWVIIVVVARGNLQPLKASANARCRGSGVVGLLVGGDDGGGQRGPTSPENERERSILGV